MFFRGSGAYCCRSQAELHAVSEEILQDEMIIQWTYATL